MVKALAAVPLPASTRGMDGLRRVWRGGDSTITGGGAAWGALTPTGASTVGTGGGALLRFTLGVGGGSVPYGPGWAPGYKRRK